MQKYLLAIAMFLPLAQAQAATKTANITAHVKLAKTCTVIAGTMEFGSLTTIVGTETQTTLISVSCNKGTAYTVALAGTVGYMTGVTTPSDHVLYTSPLQTGGATSTGVTQNWTGSGRLSVQATPSAQDYSEVRLVTVTF